MGHSQGRLAWRTYLGSPARRRAFVTAAPFLPPARRLQREWSGPASPFGLRCLHQFRHRHPAAARDLIESSAKAIAGAPGFVHSSLTGELDPGEAIRSGSVRVTGKRELLERFVDLFHIPPVPTAFA
jgi:hypothetical protein